MRKYSQFIFNAILLIVGPLSVNVFADAPNVIFILADDIGYSDVSVYNEYISGVDAVLPTPNIDRLASEGMMFTDAHAPAALCAPTRYSAMTGNYPYRGRIWGGVWGAYDVSAILPGQKPIAATMKTMGYRTAFIGKWGFGAEWYDFNDPPNIIAPNFNDTNVDVAAGIARGGPVDQGFDYSFNLPAGIQNSPYAYFENNDWYPLNGNSVIVPLNAATHEPLGSVRDGKKGDSEYDSRDAGPMLASKAVDFIDGHMNTHPGSPFLLYYSSQAVHVPHTPSLSLDGQPVQGATEISDHADLVHELDLQVGAIISKLEDENILDQTLIIFTSDNGGLDNSASQANGHYSNLELRGKKGAIYEGGHRVPFIVRWPGVVVPGGLSDQTILLSDWVATMYDMLGIAMGNQDALDAVSILPVLAGLQDENDPIRDRFIVQAAASKNTHAIRDGDDVLIYKDDIMIELYNLAADPLQTVNLIADPAYQSRITDMDAMYQADHSNPRTSPVLDYSDPNVRTPWGPTAVTIGSVDIVPVPVTAFLAGEEQMEFPELLALLQILDPAKATALADADAATIRDALIFTLDPDGDGQVALLRWDTLEERGTIGFYVDRRDGDGNGDWVRIGNDMLPGMITAPMGAEYMLIDPGARGGQVYQYRLIEQEATGSTRRYGPFTVEMLQ